MEDDSLERRPKRQKRDSSYKAKAFEKFRQIKTGVKNKYEVDEIENVFDTVDEKDYTKEVLSRMDDDWIVDDDGSGYVEDGRDIFDDDLDRDSINAAAASTSKGQKRKKHKQLSENAGRHKNLQHMISNMPAKKKDENITNYDEALSDILGEAAEAPAVSLKPKTMSRTFSPASTKQEEIEYIKKFETSLTKKPPINVHKTPKHNPFAKQKTTTPKPVPVPEEILLKDILLDKENSFPDPPMETEKLDIPVADNPTETGETAPIECTQETECFDDDLDFSQIEEKENTPQSSTNKDEVEKVWANIEQGMMDWGNVADSSFQDINIDLETSDLPLTDSGDKKVFRFFWWDAFEDSHKQPGVVFLFGKTYHEKSKSFVSCSVAVRNVERKIFFLPRTTEKNSNKPVSAQDVYNEINETIMKGLQVKHFKARPISKKFAFDPSVPAESDYIEVRYSAKDPPVTKSLEGRTFSRVFGTESSFLEIFLLDRKIKGPSWLDISNPSPVQNPVTWCKLEVNCNKAVDVLITQEVIPRPPLIVTAINMRRAMNPKTSTNEIVMLTCVTNMKYSVEKQAPSIPFQKHFCVFTCPEQQILPFNLHNSMKSYKGTTLQKMDTERALLNYFINQFAKLDSDLVVGHDLQGYQMSVLAERLTHYKNNNFNKLSRIKRFLLTRQKLEKELFQGRLVCDIKISAKELIRCRSYELDTLCQTVLKQKDNQRLDLEPEEIPKMFQTAEDILKLVSLTMQDTACILKIMYCLNVIPLALQITNIAGNIMSRTLMGGRSERNEFLLLHAFAEKDYIVPDKNYGRKDITSDKTPATRKKPTYSGGLVLEPKIGFYDKLILLMDFNSLYPSIIQEYNICFTTMPPGLSEDNMVLPDKSLALGILPLEIRKLVESRKEVKKLMATPDISSDLRNQYNIRQTALKLTANSMYGCLGFANSRFYAKNLAALITYKGRDILTNTQEVVQKMGFEVIYGDTDSLMINTNIVDFEQVFKIGQKIKTEINKLYKQVELDIDGVFKYLLLLKKKKYAAVTVSKTKTGDLKTEVEFKGLDIVRRDWSRLAAEAGKYILNQILSDQPQDERVNNIFQYLRKIREDVEGGKVPLSLLVITKQLTKNPSLYADASSLPHVQVALRYNKDFGGHFRVGDTVSYVICDDGSQGSATQRGYHIEELKNSSKLKVDVKYYLEQQIHPVISRICEPIEELDAFQIAESLGVDSAHIKKGRIAGGDCVGENITRPEVKFRNVDKFVFKCLDCKSDIEVDGVLRGNTPVLEKCANSKCDARPADYVEFIQNQMSRSINFYIDKYYQYEMYCEDPMCSNETTRMPMNFSGRFPVCGLCKNSVLLKKYTESNLYSQISYFQYIFDLTRLPKKPILEYKLEKAYTDLKETVEKRLEFCAYSVVDLTSMYALFSLNKEKSAKEDGEAVDYIIEDDFDEDEEV